MLAEFLEALSDKIEETIRAEVENVEGFPDQVLVSDRNGHTFRDVPPPRRKHTVSGLEDLFLACRDEKIAPSPEIYHGEESVVVLLDREGRRSTITMPLIRSGRWKTIESLAGKTFTPKDAIRLLRYGLHDTGIEAVVAGLRRIDWSRSSTGTSVVEHGRESLGRSVEAAIQQADKIPEEFAVRVPAFLNQGFRDFTALVRCGVYVDLEVQQIAITPLADELEWAMNAIQNQIHEALVAALPNVPIFNGVP
jgi:hypothetical protein